MSDDAFGFSATRRSLQDKVRTFSPENSESAEEQLSIQRVDAAGAALGFVSRDAGQPRPSRRRKEIGPTVALNMRMPEEPAGRFIAFCESNRMSYWEGIVELMKRAAI